LIVFGLFNLLAEINFYGFIVVAMIGSVK